MIDRISKALGSPRGNARRELQSSSEAQAQLKKQATLVAARAGEFISAHPAASLAAAVAVGITIGWLVKRK